MTEQQTHSTSPGFASPSTREIHESARQTEDLKAKAQETTDELRRKGAEMVHESKETARRLKDEAVHTAADAAREAQHQAMGYADQQKGRMADELETFGEAMSRAADELRQEDDARVAGYADMAAGRLASAADYLRSREVGDLVSDVESFARRRPEVFFGATFLVGMGIARFLKASRHRGYHDDGDRQRSRSSTSTASSRSPASAQQPERSASQPGPYAGPNDPLSYH
jgi:F0F1-type ATP synthase membrane subunit b/b'